MRLKRVSGLDVATGMFIAVAIWIVATAASMWRAYQDAWVLEGLLIPIILLLLLYVLIVGRTHDLQRCAVLAAALSFVLSATPSLKYVYMYASTVDSAVHYSTIRSIASTGVADPLSVYRNTPGFHALVAVLSDISGAGYDFWTKVITAILAATLPLGFYMLCKWYSVPTEATKYILTLSAMCLPAPFIVEGTTFTLPLFVSLTIIYLLRDAGESRSKHRLSLTFMLILFVVTMILWHPSSSLVTSAGLLTSGGLAVSGYRRVAFLKHTRGLWLLGLLTLVATFFYWMLGAEYVWDKFAENARMALRPSTTPALVPRRVLEIGLDDLAIVASLYHARDLSLLIFAGLGATLCIGRNRLAEDRSLLQSYLVLWLSLALLLLLIFATGFGAQGYRRFLAYVVAVTPVLAGYGLYSLAPRVRPGGKPVPGVLMQAVAVPAILISALIQLYPYQPAVAAFSSGYAEPADTPLLWFHQVNTDYQRRMLEFAAGQIPGGAQVLVDYIGYQQSGLFFGLDSVYRLRQLSWGALPEPAYVLLHWPGVAGAYMEQAEVRSHDFVQRMRTSPGTNVLYDNGGSFILYYPGNARQLPPRNR